MQTRDLGTKHTCYKCDTKFYDLKKPTPLCPKCGTDQREAPPEARNARRPPVTPAPVEDEATDEVEETEDETDDEADE